MKATTIKLEEDILNNLNLFRPARVSLSAFVRQILEREIQKRKLKDSAQAYAQFLRDHLDEQELLSEWEQSDLASPPVNIRARK